MRVFFPKPLTIKTDNGGENVTVGREWVFVKDHTIWFSWILKGYKKEEKYCNLYKSYQEFAKRGISGDPYEYVLNRVIEKEPENPLKGKFIKLLQKKIKERDNAKKTTDLLTQQETPPKS